MEMRRSERCVDDLDKIYDILFRCDTVTLGFNTEDAPYLIPMTFACNIEDGKIAIYFHCAQGGRKYEILSRDNRVSVEGHLYYKTVPENGGITAKYESVTGWGYAEKLETREDKIAAFKLMLDHYKQSGFPAESCKGLAACDVFRITMTEICGKHNL